LIIIILSWTLVYSVLDEEFEIDLAAKRVDARDFHSHVVAEAKFVAAAFDEVFLFVIVVVIAGEESKWIGW